MIGKLDRDQRSGVRDQKRKDLRRRGLGCLGGGGLDKKMLGVGGSRERLVCPPGFYFAFGAGFGAGGLAAFRNNA